MASISLPLQPQTASAFSHYFDSADRESSGHSRRNLTMSAPLPNPPFVFPARDPNDAHDPGSGNAAKGPPPLPAFSFNPGSIGSNQTSSAPGSALNRPNGHRRRYSEFVGAETLSSPGNISVAQTNDEGLAPAPVKLPPPGPGFSAGGRRRHAHRRSAAISSVDLTAITHALEKPYPESAPCTPADVKRGNKTPGEPPKPMSYSATNLSRPTPPVSPQTLIDRMSLNSQDGTNQQSLNSRPFAGNSPKESVILSSPQPGTPAGKSDNTISAAKDGSPLGPKKSKPRPKTADASLMFEQNGGGVPDDCSQTKRPLSAAGHSRSHKSMSAGILDPTSRINSYHADDDGLFPPSFRRSSDDDESDTSAYDSRDESGSPASALKKRSKAKKRQKKVRSWAGALLTRNKSKRHHSKKDASEADSALTPPVLTRTNSELGSGLDVDFDDDNIVVIRTPTNPTSPEFREVSAEADSWASLENSWKPRSFYEQNTTDDAMSPVIDLDAALGPFNTPDMRTGRVSESGFSAASRRMYSGGRRGEFIGPEMRYHRRAESAPEMPPFDRSFLGSHRFTNTSTLENPDVFYEEEEDAFLAATSESGKDSEENLSPQAAPADPKVVDDQSEDSKDSSNTLTRQSIDNGTAPEHTGLGIQETPARESTSDGVASSTPQEEPKQAELQSVPVQPQKISPQFSFRPKTPLELVKHEDWQSRIPIPPSPDVSPRFLPVDHRPVTSPTGLPPAIPPFSLAGGCSLPGSSFPSPDFTVSSEAPRSITTSSTNDQFRHASVEDVPSLSSSASTMTNTLNRVSATFFARSRLSTDRSASFSAAVHRRSSQPNSKRSSLASLSKLVVGPHAERSKLSHEEKPPGDEHEKVKKKGRRISRLMHFWRTKDKDRLNEDIVQE